MCRVLTLLYYACVAWKMKVPLFYCISSSRVLHVSMIYYTNKLIWIDGVMSKSSDIHMGILQSKSLVYGVFVSTWTALLLQYESTQYKNRHSDLQKEIHHNLFFIHCLFQGSKSWHSEKKNVSLSHVEHRQLSKYHTHCFIFELENLIA